MKIIDNLDELTVNKLIKLIDDNDDSIILDTKCSCEKNSDYNKKLLKEVAERLRGEFYEKFVNKENINKYTSIKIEIIKNYIDYVLTNDTFILNKIRLLERQLNEFNTNDKVNLKNALYGVKIAIEDALKMYIDFDKVTVYEFFAYIDYIKTKNNNIKAYETRE